MLNIELWKDQEQHIKAKKGLNFEFYKEQLPHDEIYLHIDHTSFSFEFFQLFLIREDNSIFATMSVPNENHW